MPERAPNVVFVLTDDQGYGDLGCHGNPYIRTPHLDRLHAESVRLTNFHVAPTCAPTRAGLMTGHYANSTGVWHTIGGRSLLRRDERTLADRFSAAGYVTGLFGKWHLGDAYPYRAQDRGFQEVVSHGGGGVGNTPDHWGNTYVDDRYCRNGEWERFEGYCTDVWFREGLDFIARHVGNPFFCYIATNAPHLPHIVPERYVQPYRELVATDPEAARFFGVSPEREGGAARAGEEMLRFYGMVSCIDENVGALRAGLEALGLAQDTILVFMTDNGSAGGLALDRQRFVTAGYNAGMRAGKGSPYEGGHRVPCFLHWEGGAGDLGSPGSPGGPASPGGGLRHGEDEATLAGSIDFLPTLLELCGLPYGPEEFHGRSLAPLLRRAGGSGSANDRRGEGGPGRALVTDTQRLLRPLKWRQSCVMQQDEAGEWRLINGRELYELRRDPEQRRDLSGEHPEVVARLRDEYDAWWRLVSARLDEPIAVRLGDPGGGTVRLTSHDWRRDPGAERVTEPQAAGDDVRAVWNQAQVRQGVAFNGYWEVEVVRAGRYRLELRRWPREASLGLASGIPGAEPRPYNAIRPGPDGYGGGVALPITRAAVRAAGVSAAADVPSDAPAAVFELELPAGVAQLETSLGNGQGLDVGAYYVYVDRVGGEGGGGAV